MKRRSWLVTWSLAAILAGCSSTPDIPDDAAPVQYKSTATTEEAETPAEPTLEEALANGQELVQATGPVATVNGESIEAKVFNEEIQRVVASGMPPAMANRFKDTLVEKLVERRLLEGALKTEGITVSDEERSAKLQEVQTEFAKAAQQTGVTLDDLVRQLGITRAELEQSIEQSIAIEKVLVKRGLIDPADEDVRRYYDENPEQFTQPEAVQARHILIAVEPGASEEMWAEAKKKADEVHKLATAKKADFAKIAESHSVGPTSTKGGELGFVARGTTVEEFETALFELKAGQVSAPVRSPFGWHVIKAEAKRAEGLVPFDEVKDQLRQQFRGQMTRNALESYIADLRSKATVEIHSQNIR
jgi:parvulin-like peptidyl-prolyl isomerase